VAGLPTSPEQGGRNGGPGPAVRLAGVSRAYPTQGGTVWAVREVSLEVAPGDAVAVTGPSGSGKSTLLNLVAGLDRPTAGKVAVLGRQLDGLREHELTAFRAGSVGFVFQDPHLLPGLTAVENVVVARLPWQPRRELEARARELLTAVGLEQRLDHPPARLSGGERQRVAIARALVGGPPLLLADEPTGNLDAASTEALLALVERLRRALRLTVMVATHDPAVATIADRVVRLVGGRVVGDHAIDGRAPLDLHALE
jgi:ABC-type lipoprotein export system ATPase subunit